MAAGMTFFADVSRLREEQADLMGTNFSTTPATIREQWRSSSR